MTDINNQAIVFQCDYVDRPAGSDSKAIPTFTEKQLQWAPDFQDIHIENIVCRGTHTGILASGIQGLNCVHDIVIKNATIFYNHVGQKIDEKTAKLKLENVNLIENKF